MMKSAKKRKIAAVLGVVGDLLEKCGGPGGTMGPCPGGGSSGGQNYHTFGSLAKKPRKELESIHAEIFSVSNPKARPSLISSMPKASDKDIIRDIIRRQDDNKRLQLPLHLQDRPAIDFV